MKSAVILMALTLAGCATQPLTQETAETKSPEPTITVLAYDQQCADVAEYAKSVAMFRDVNIGLNEINYILKEPPDYPVEAIQRDIYSRIGENPLETSIAIYTECVESGHASLMHRYSKEQAKYRQGLEDAARLKIETLRHKEEVTQALAHMKELRAAELAREKKAPNYRDKYGEPIYVERE